MQVDSSEAIGGSTGPYSYWATRFINLHSLARYDGFALSKHLVDVLIRLVHRLSKSPGSLRRLSLMVKMQR